MKAFLRYSGTLVWKAECSLREPYSVVNAAANLAALQAPPPQWPVPVPLPVQSPVVVELEEEPFIVEPPGPKRKKSNQRERLPRYSPSPDTL
jgi:hypothetical protein